MRETWAAAQPTTHPLQRTANASHTVAVSYAQHQLRRRFQSAETSGKVQAGVPPSVEAGEAKGAVMRGQT